MKTTTVSVHGKASVVRMVIRTHQVDRTALVNVSWRSQRTVYGVRIDGRYIPCDSRAEAEAMAKAAS